LNRKVFVFTAILVLLVLLLHTFLSKKGEEPAYAEQNKPAPNVKLPDLEGQWINMRTDSEKPVFLTFSTSCFWEKYCRNSSEASWKCLQTVPRNEIKRWLSS